MMQSVLSESEKKLIQKLHEREYFVEQVSNYTPNIIYVLDLEKNKFTFTNQRVEGMMGCENILLDKIHPFDYTSRLDHINACLSLRKNEMKDIIFRMKVKCGAWNWFHVRDIAYKFDTRGNATHTLGIVQNIHEDKIKEERLLEKKIC